MARRRQRFFTEIKDWVDEQSKGKLLMTALIIAGIVYIIFGFGYGADYHDQVNRELELAKRICEESNRYVMSNPNRLKHGKSELDKFPLDGEEVKLEFVKYPQVIFLRSGFNNLDSRQAAEDIYCFYEDPRDSSADFFYNYKRKIWKNKVRFRS